MDITYPSGGLFRHVEETRIVVPSVKGKHLGFFSLNHRVRGCVTFAAIDEGIGRGTIKFFMQIAGFWGSRTFIQPTIFKCTQGDSRCSIYDGPPIDDWDGSGSASGSGSGSDPNERIPQIS